VTGILDLPVFVAIESAEIALSLRTRPDDTLRDLMQLVRELPAARAELEEIERRERLLSLMDGPAEPKVEPRPRREGEPSAHCGYCGARAWDAHLVYDGAGRKHPDEWSCKDLDGCIARHDEALRRDGVHPIAVRLPADVQARKIQAEAVVRRVKAARPAVKAYQDEIRQQIDADRQEQEAAAAAEHARQVAKALAWKPDPWSHTMRNAGHRSELVGGMDRRHTIGHPANRGHLIGSK